MSAPTAGPAAADLQPQLDPTHLAVPPYPADWQPPATVTDGFFAMIRGEHEVTAVAAGAAAGRTRRGVKVPYRWTAHGAG